MLSFHARQNGTTSYLADAATIYHSLLTTQAIEDFEHVSQALDHMLEDKSIAQPLNLVAHGYITGQYAVTWALAHPEAVKKLVIMDMPLNSKVRECDAFLGFSSM